MTWTRSLTGLIRRRPLLSRKSKEESGCTGLVVVSQRIARSDTKLVKSYETGDDADSKRGKAGSDGRRG